MIAKPVPVIMVACVIQNFLGIIVVVPPAHLGFAVSVYMWWTLVLAQALLMTYFYSVVTIRPQDGFGKKLRYVNLVLASGFFIGISFVFTHHFPQACLLAFLVADLVFVFWTFYVRRQGLDSRSINADIAH
jgi:hypothetical protein